jgi:hypothetical protein
VTRRVLYLYAIVDAVAPKTLKKPLRAVRLRAKMFVVVAERKDTPSMSAKNLVAHDRIVRALHHSARAILPLRFGSTIANDAELKATFTPLRALIQDAMKRVRDAVQMTMRFVSPLPKKKVSGGPGTRYLKKRMQETSPPEEMQPVLSAVKPRDVKVARSGDLLTMYVLLDRDQVATWRRSVKSISGFTMTGPFPPYAFAELLS